MPATRDKVTPAQRSRRIWRTSWRSDRPGGPTAKQYPATPALRMTPRGNLILVEDADYEAGL
ncbi:hypothetical protein GCM10027053_12380 [Intrasporangium mesophilum]